MRLAGTVIDYALCVLVAVLLLAAMKIFPPHDE